MDDSTRATEKTLKRPENLLIKLLLIPLIYVPILYFSFNYFYQNDPVPKEDTTFNTAFTETYNETQPDYVFIGNSMLDTRIDLAKIEELTNSKVILFTNGGSASAQWYLYFKNVVVPSEYNPKKVFMFFRDDMLTQPTYRSTGKYIADIDALKTDDEQIYDLVMGGVTLTLNERLMGYIHKDAYSQLFKDKVSTLSLRLIGSTDNENFLTKMNDAFGLDKLRLTAAGDQTEDAPSPESLIFNDVLDRSFLPEIVRLADQNDIDLIFIRVKKRPNDKGITEQSIELKEYITNLRAYIEDNGLTLYDFTDDPNITLDYYKDGDHIEKTEEYTEYFYNKLIIEFK